MRTGENFNEKKWFFLKKLANLSAYVTRFCITTINTINISSAAVEEFFSHEQTNIKFYK